MEEAEGFKRLLDLEEPKYSIELIAARTGKSPAFVATRLKLVDLIPAAVEAFYRDEIGVGHALLLARLQPGQQEQALAACFREDWSGGGKAKRILLPVRQLQAWIEQNVLLILKEAPFSKRDTQLVPAAGSCLECPKRTGFNTLLFAGISEKSDACSDPACYAAKLDAHVKKTIAAKPKLVQITTAHGKPAEGSPILPRNQYVAIREDKPQNKYQQEAPEYKTCKSVTEAIVADGAGKGELRKVCADPNCPVHHPKRKPSNADASFKAAQEKQRREEAIANAIGVRTLTAIAEAVPVRLMKRDLLFIAERLAAVANENHLAALARQYGIKKVKENDSIGKLFLAYLRQAEESILGSVIVQLALLLAAARGNGAQVLREAAGVYKVDTEAIAAKVKREFADREKAKATKKPAAKPAVKSQPKPVKKQAAA
jgi:ParB family chromosome partitioning protein